MLKDSISGCADKQYVLSQERIRKVSTPRTMNGGYGKFGYGGVALRALDYYEEALGREQIEEAIQEKKEYY